MGSYKEIKGDLIKLALAGEFDVVVHGCNCFCTMGAGIAPQMAKAFGCDKFADEAPHQKGNIDKLGNINWEPVYVRNDDEPLYVVNAYTQYSYGMNHIDGKNKPLDYDALSLCLKKINHQFKGLHIGLPQIGCGLAGGNWNAVKHLIQFHLEDCDVTVVIYEK